MNANLYSQILFNGTLKLSLSFKEQHPEIRWNDIIGFRNRIVHDYGKTDYAIVYEVIANDVPLLIVVFK